MSAEQQYKLLQDEQALAEHIEAALAVERPTGTGIEIIYQLVSKIFRPVMCGTQNIPDRPCLFVGNHSLFALDGWIMGPVMQKELDRFIRGLGDRFLFDNESVGNTVMQVGGVLGHPDVCSALMENGSDLLVFPGGAHEAVKSASDMYSLQWKERYGFVKLAARYGYTIMPFGMVGPDEFYGHLMEGHELADSPIGRLLSKFGVLTDETRPDMIPPIPVGIFGSLLPKPQRCYLGFGEAVDLSSYKGKKLGKKELQNIRNRVAAEVEDQLNQMLLLREQRKGNDGLLRRILTI